MSRSNNMLLKHDPRCKDLTDKRFLHRGYSFFYDLVTDRMGTGENYKGFLSSYLWRAKFEKEVADKHKEYLQDKIRKLQEDMKTIDLIRDIYHCDIELVEGEYSFRKKITNLLKKHSYLKVDYQGDDDVFTTWVYSDDFDSSVDENDPYCDDHFCDSYEEAHDRCLDYIEYHSKL